MREYRIDDVHTVFKGFFSVDQATVSYEKLDGTWSKPADRLSAERGDAVAVLVHDPERAVFTFVRQFRFPTARHGEPFPLEVVAGAIDKGETPEVSARREVEEETGIKVQRMTKLSEMYGSPGGLSEMVTIFLAEGRHEGGGGGLEGEDVEVIEIPVDEALAMLDRGEIRDAKSQIALLRFAAGRKA